MKKYIDVVLEGKPDVKVDAHIAVRMDDIHIAVYIDEKDIGILKGLLVEKLKHTCDDFEAVEKVEEIVKDLGGEVIDTSESIYIDDWGNGEDCSEEK